MQKSTKNKLAVQGSVEGIDPLFPSDGLRHFWRFNETLNTDNRADAVGGVTLTAKNGPRPHPIPKGLKNRATYFNTGQLTALYNSVNPPDVKQYPEGFSACGWIKILPVSGTETYDCMIGRYTSNAGSNDQWMIYRDSPGSYWNFLIGLDDNTTYVSTNSDTWQNAHGYEYDFLCGVCDYRNRRVTLYVNGVAAGSSTWSSSLNIRSVGSTALAIGAYNVGSSSQVQHSHSIISGVGLWDRPLSLHEVLNLYNNGKGLKY